MYIIVGLGNPKREYENTRHNIGFDVIDRLAEQENIAVLEKKHKALIGKGYVAGQKCILAKPQTFMNLSGESVRELIDYYKVDEKEELIVISDEGMGKPDDSDPVKMRFSDSRIAASGRPTISKEGRLRLAEHSTVTSYPSAP